MEDTNEPSNPAGSNDWPKTAGEFNERAQQFVREDPTKAVGAAVLIGVLLTVFPIGRLIGGLFRLLFSIAKPVLLIAGLVKVYQELEKQQKP